MQRNLSGKKALIQIMEPNNSDNWNSTRYGELNAYFRLKIKTLLESDPFLIELVAKQKSISLPDLVDRMSVSDQQSWAEFLELDRIKLQLDLKNHLEGNGTPFNSEIGNFPDSGGQENYW